MDFRWPVLIKDHELTLRPLRLRDKTTWEKVRRLNRDWLAPWEATRPLREAEGSLPTYYQMVRQYNKDGKSMRQMALGIWITSEGEEQFIGQITLGGIVFGVYRGAHIGYWIDQRYANRGYMTRAVKALTGFAFRELKLHRIEINLRPENAGSKKVAEKAMQRKTGARGLRSILENILLETMYTLPSLEDVSKVVIDESVVMGESEPLLLFENPHKVARKAQD